MSEPAEPTPEELLEAIRNMKVADLVLSTAATLAQLGFAKLDEPTRDLAEARIAIEALTALLDSVEGSLPEGTLRDFHQVVANLQLAYADAASSGQ